MDLYAVMGNPVAHSKSPKIHSLFAGQTGEPVEYTAIQAPLDGFATAVNSFFERGGKGMNVTVPFKEEAWQLVNQRSERARLAGAVNTLLMQEGELYGDNTDGAGLVRDLTGNNSVNLKGKKVLVLGAGGAVRGVLLPLLQQQTEMIVIANRTVAKADQLAELFTSYGNVQSSAFESLESVFDVVINGTSASLGGAVPPVPPEVIGRETVTYDMMYGSEVTPFNRWAQTHGAVQTIDGLGMLVEQAAESFTIWRKIRPETQSVLETLKAGN